MSAPPHFTPPDHQQSQQTATSTINQNKGSSKVPAESITTTLKSNKMSFQKVIEVLQKLEEKIDNTLSVIKLDDITWKVDVHKQKISLLTDKIDTAISDHDKVQIMADIIVCQDEKITQLNDKILAMQAWSMKQNLILSGVTETENENSEKISTDFFKNKMKLDDVKIDAAHRIGTGKYRPMVIRLANQWQKAKIFGSINKLKGLKNENKRFYRLDNQLPDELNAKKKHLLYHLKEAKAVPLAHRLDVAFKKGQLYVNQKQYIQEIVAPRPTDMLFAPQSLIKRSKELCIHKGDKLVERASTFQGYITEVQSIQDINAAYYKIRCLHGCAHHILCAYQLPGCNGPVNQDCIDDGEHSASINLLQYLKKHELLNMAIFVVRYYGGTKLGPSHFQMIMDAAKSSYENMVNTSFEQEADPNQQKNSE